MRRRNRIVKIINTSFVLLVIFGAILTIFLIKNKKYKLDIESASSIVGDLIVIDYEYYDEFLKVLNGQNYKKSNKKYGGLRKEITITSENDVYEFSVYYKEKVITYELGGIIYVNKDIAYVNRVLDAIDKYDYSLVKLDAAKIEYYKNEYAFDTKYDVDLKGNNTILLTINKNVKNVMLYQVFEDGSEILMSNAKKLVANDQIAYHINITESNFIKIEVIDDYKTNIYKGYLKDGKVVFEEITRVPEIVLNPTDIDLLVEKEMEVVIENFKGSVEWHSENEEIATVDNGVVKGISAGKTRIYVITQNKEYYYTNVIVTDPEKIVITINRIELSEEEITVGMYGTYQLSVDIFPEDATNKKLQWSSSNPKVATVDKNGLVTGLNSGRATISVRTSNGLVKTCKVLVTIVELQDIELTHESYELKVGETVDLDIKFIPENASIKDVKWSTSDVFVADVDASGKVTANLVGKATITVETKNGIKKTCLINVIEGETKEE